jgi:TrmH family RNA methyltransferase
MRNFVENRIAIMIGKNKIKWIRSLEMKKFRNESGCFLAEGNKLVADLLPFFDCILLLARPSWMATQGDIRAGELIVAEDGDIERASLLKTPQDALAVFRRPDWNLQRNDIQNDLTLVLDGVQDPGNLGTIVRLADWFGISAMVCSPSSADIFAPKTVQATMGALARVKVVYRDLPDWMATEAAGLPVFGTFLEGNNIYSETLPSAGLIVLGSEGRGISREVEKLVTRKLFIPSFPRNCETVESLNVAVSAAIVCSEFRRNR